MNLNNKRRPLGRVLTAAAATVMALAGLTVGSGTAHADSVGNLPSGPYTLNITKLQQPATAGTVTNGQQQNVSGLTPVPGVQYQIQPVNGVDLSTAAGWQTASTLTVSSTGTVTGGGTTYTVGSATQLPMTNSAGGTSYTTSSPAVYLVTEVSAPAPVVGVAPPFLVTLPLPLASDNSWLTNVYVYPKNTTANTPTKTINDSTALGLGQTVNWTINSTIPTFAQGTSLNSYVVSDTLDPRLTLTSTSAVTVTLGGTAVPAADYTVAINSGVLTVTFNSTGITLLAANAGSTLAVGIPTTVTSVGSGTIQNTPATDVNGTTYTGTPVQTTWGSVQLKKVDQSSPGNTLSGAVFEVFTSQADAQALTNPVSVSGQTQFTSGATGLVDIAGLKAQLNGQGPNLTYYIVEVTPPTGFQVAPSFSQSSGGFAVTVSPGGISANPQIVVADPQTPPISLPLTGSTGTMIFAASGTALIALALSAAFLFYRRKAEADTAQHAEL
jgi:fimbrial isopeptide formation D2 family protein/LPXTG-motif cell wall-anchored protein